MAMYASIPTVRTYIRVNSNTGKSETQLWYNDKIACVTPTDQSQIRPRRETCLWQRKQIFTFQIEGQHNNPNIASYKPLQEEVD